ncbi:hypothetical protein EJ08DRAFT_649311 [Tothia fuscella]|uniref:Zinc finger PHD-type domain-containing protein n=1 Tax=Tothia fuscella TaxID=1048955 RepID=A0A9P4NTA6_9PEZI|nr:hypothetical protein EJ08DRAFT_649311 [Tothia fuscella]
MPRGLRRPLPALPSTNSVSSTSSKPERSTRSKLPQKSSTPHSLSSEELSENNGVSEAPPARRSKRKIEEEVDEIAKVEEEAADDIDDEDGEVTRCVCEQPEYPGLPVETPTSSHGRKGSHAPTLDADALADDAGGWFIQCDECKVWQHGGCVGIMEQDVDSINYSCEMCKPDLHQRHTSSTGQKYTRYLPMWEKTHPKASHRKSSVTKDTETKAPKEKGKGAQVLNEPFGKRRSTMNSRAAYDEDEVLRKVLEESKTEGSVVADGGSRKGKRGRYESEDVRPDIKRQRTASSGASSRHSEAGSSAIESDGEGEGGKVARRARGAARKSQREKDIKEREKERTEAANKRKGRVDRRRAEGSDPPEEQSRQSSNGKQSPPDNDQRETPLPPTPITSKRGGRRPGAGRGRGGHHAAAATERDGKTGSPKDPTEIPGSGGEISNSNNHPNGNSAPNKRGRQRKESHVSNESDPSKSDSNGNNKDVTSDPSKRGGDNNGNGNGTKENGTTATTKRDKDPSMLELKRRAALMLEFLTSAQSDMPKVPESGIGIDVTGAVLLTSGGNAVNGSPLVVEAERLKGRLEKWQEMFA